MLLEGANSSYLPGNDTASGWGQRFFFTFYSEFGPRTVSAGAEVGVLGVILLASLTANLSIAAAVLRYRELRTVTNCFLLNLAAADLLFALGIPAIAAARLTQEWALGDVACRLLPYSQVNCGDPRHVDQSTISCVPKTISTLLAVNPSCVCTSDLQSI